MSDGSAEALFALAMGARQRGALRAAEWVSDPIVAPSLPTTAERMEPPPASSRSSDCSEANDVTAADRLRRRIQALVRSTGRAYPPPPPPGRPAPQPEPKPAREETYDATREPDSEPPRGPARPPTPEHEQAARRFWRSEYWPPWEQMLEGGVNVAPMFEVGLRWRDERATSEGEGVWEWDADRPSASALVRDGRRSASAPPVRDVQAGKEPAVGLSAAPVRDAAAANASAAISGAGPGAPPRPHPLPEESGMLAMVAAPVRPTPLDREPSARAGGAAARVTAEICRHGAAGDGAAAAFLGIREGDGPRGGAGSPGGAASLLSSLSSDGGADRAINGAIDGSDGPDWTSVPTDPEDRPPGTARASAPSRRGRRPPPPALSIAGDDHHSPPGSAHLRLSSSSSSDGDSCSDDFSAAHRLPDDLSTPRGPAGPGNPPPRPSLAHAAVTSAPATPPTAPRVPATARAALGSLAGPSRWRFGSWRVDAPGAEGGPALPAALPARRRSLGGWWKRTGQAATAASASRGGTAVSRAAWRGAGPGSGSNRTPPGGAKPRQSTPGSVEAARGGSEADSGASLCSGGASLPPTSARGVGMALSSVGTPTPPGTARGRMVRGPGTDASRASWRPTLRGAGAKLWTADAPRHPSTASLAPSAEPSVTTDGVAPAGGSSAVLALSSVGGSVVGRSPSRGSEEAAASSGLAQREVVAGGTEPTLGSDGSTRRVDAGSTRGGEVVGGAAAASWTAGGLESDSADGEEEGEEAGERPVVLVTLCGGMWD